MLLHEEQSGRFLRRPKQGYPAATVAEFCTAVPKDRRYARDAC